MMFHNREQEQPRSHWWFPNRCYFLLLMLESFIGLITFVFTVLLTPGQSLELCADGVAILTGLAGIVDALMTPRNRFSGFTTAFIVVDLAAFGLSFISLPVIVVRISTNPELGTAKFVSVNLPKIVEREDVCTQSDRACTYESAVSEHEKQPHVTVT
ncbi:uncharacterized protein LOC132915289 [Bombus pascuorum]|uniref:uncharacterized protein LOC132915289 n=1 Tax=Bombus pascuorum TaxID=65598 RepID=UPI00298EC483|nr:uncharacterized protein LOC132915289 [Bombus pascuorum]